MELTIEDKIALQLKYLKILKRKHQTEEVKEKIQEIKRWLNKFSISVE